MDAYDLVFHDDNTPIEILIERLSENKADLELGQATEVGAARAVEGELWSPQLPAYRSWQSPEDSSGEGAGGGGGTDGTLLVVGSLGMGISDEKREKLLEQAQSERPGKTGDPGTQGFSASSRREAGGAPDVPGRRDARGASDAPGRRAVRKGSDVTGRVAARGAIGVRRDEGGYAIVAVDLHRLAAAAGHEEDLVVVLPSSVQGVPVVRIAAEAFARRLVQGVGVRLLAVPDSVERIGAGAFLALSARRIHLGAGLRSMGEQPCDLAGVSPRLKRREYSVDPRNRRFSSQGGSLFSDGGAQLLFLALPYEMRVELPAGVERIGAAAFAEGCEPPAVVACPDTLARVDARGWDDAVWLCPSRALAHRSLARRGVRLAGPEAVELEGCWYDFDRDGAVLVAGPPPPASVSRHFALAAAVRAAAARGQSACSSAPSPGQVASTAAHAQPASDDLLALPRLVGGRPLVRIGVRALPTAPSSLVLSDTVRVVERDNACKGTRRLALPEGLRSIGAHCFCSRVLEGPVPIPASVASVGEGSFEYAVCRLAHTGSIVHLSADQLLSCFLAEPPDGIPFDFVRYDELLRSGKNLPDRLGAVLHRLAAPYRLDDRMRGVLLDVLLEREHEAQARVAREGDRAMVEALVQAGFINERSFDRQIELLRAANRTDCVLYLMESHRSQARPVSVRDRFAL